MTPTLERGYGEAIKRECMHQSRDGKAKEEIEEYKADVGEMYSKTCCLNQCNELRA